VIYGFWVVNRMAFKGNVVLELAAQFQALARDQPAVAPVMIGHLLTGISQVLTADFEQGRAELNHAVSLYDTAAHGPLATRFGHDVEVSALCWRALAAWWLGDPAAAVADTRRAVDAARALGHAATLMYALSHTSLALIYCGEVERARTMIDELVALAEEKGTLFWKGYGMLLRGWLVYRAGDAAGAVDILSDGIAAVRSTGATAYAPWYLSNLAAAHAAAGQRDDAVRCIDEAVAAMNATGEVWCAAEVHRIAAGIASMSPQAALLLNR
jgi:predicted ATPase